MWGSFQFSSSKIYLHLIGEHNVNDIFKRIWKTKCQHKHIVFFWLLLRDRLSTRNMLRRKGMGLPSFDCVLCASDRGNTISSFSGLSLCSKMLGDFKPADHSCWPTSDNRQFQQSARHSFCSRCHHYHVLVHMDGQKWSDLQEHCNLHQFSQLRFKSEFALVVLRAKRTAQPAMSTWMQTLL